MGEEKARLILPDGREEGLPVMTDTMGAKSIDITALRSSTGYITYDPGFVNTGSCMSRICYIDGEKGILRYRGYDILGEGTAPYTCGTCELSESAEQTLASARQHEGLLQGIST